MPNGEDLIIYRAYSDEELQSEIEWLRAQRRNGYVSQSVGGKTYTRSPAEIKSMLAAATRVAQERSLAGFTPMERGAWGVSDFSRVRV